MSNEMNKIFAAVLIAGIVAMLAGFIAEQMTGGEHEPEKNAVEIDGSAFANGGGAGGPAAESKPEPILAMIASADPAHGEELTKACAACHSFEKGGPDKTGPDLWNVLTRGRGAEPNFAYSDGMKAKGGKWNYEDLNHFLWKPKKFIDGTKMNFIGLKKPEDRAAVIAYLRTRADSAPALPGAADIAAEEKDLAPAAKAEGEAASPAGTVTTGTEATSANPNAAANPMPATTPKQDSATAQDAKTGGTPTVAVKPSDTPGSAATGDKQPPVKAEEKK